MEAATGRTGLHKRSIYSKLLSKPSSNFTQRRYLRHEDITKLNFKKTILFKVIQMRLLCDTDIICYFEMFFLFLLLKIIIKNCFVTRQLRLVSPGIFTNHSEAIRLRLVRGPAPALVRTVGAVMKMRLATPLLEKQLSELTIS